LAAAPLATPLRHCPLAGGPPGRASRPCRARHTCVVGAASRRRLSGQRGELQQAPVRPHYIATPCPSSKQPARGGLPWCTHLSIGASQTLQPHVTACNSSQRQDEARWRHRKAHNGRPTGFSRGLLHSTQCSRTSGEPSRRGSPLHSALTRAGKWCCKQRLRLKGRCASTLCSSAESLRPLRT